MGKSNLLEAIYFCHLLTSFRTKRSEQLRLFDAEFFSLKSTIANTENQFSNELFLSIDKDNKKILKINNQTIKKSKDFFNIIDLVCFVPEDLLLVNSSSGSHRRQFLNLLLCQLSNEYFFNLQKYNNLIKTKNLLLKKYQPSNQTNNISLKTLNDLLIKYASLIYQERLAICQELNQQLKNLAKQLFKNKQVNLKYINQLGDNLSHTISLSEIQNRFSQQLKKFSNKELAKGFALCGPHLDNLTFFMDNKEFSKFASYGQCRLLALSLKLAQSKILSHWKEQKLVFLIDDVLSELDSQKQQLFLNYLSPASQVFIAMVKGLEINNSKIQTNYLQVEKFFEKK